MIQSIKILATAGLLLNAQVGHTTNYTTKQDGGFNNSSTWVSNNDPGTAWNLADTVFIKHDVDLNTNLSFSGILIIESIGNLSGTNAVSANNSAKIIADGSFNPGGLTLNGSVSMEATTAINVSGNFSLNSNSSFSSTNSVTTAGYLMINTSGIFNVQGNQPVTVSGNLSTMGSPTVSLGGDLLCNHFTLNGNSTTTINGNAIIAGNLTTNSTKELLIHSPSVSVSGNTTIGSGATLTSGLLSMFMLNGYLNVNGDLNNHGTIMVTGNLTMNTNSKLHNIGSLIVNGTHQMNGGTLTNDNNLRFNSTVMIDLPATLTGTGNVFFSALSGNTLLGSIMGTLDICNSNSTSPILIGGGTIASTVTICNTNSAMPLWIDLIRFYLISENNEVQFNWSTAAEINNEKFVIERSTDLTDFEPILEQAGMGESNTITEYVAQYQEVGDGQIYYRLVSYDYNGTEHHYPIIQHDFTIANRSQPVQITTKEKELIVIPSPQSTQPVRLSNITVTNLSGQTQYEVNQPVLENPVHFELTSGIYVVSLVSTDFSMVQKLRVP